MSSSSAQEQPQTAFRPRIAAQHKLPVAKQQAPSESPDAAEQSLADNSARPGDESELILKREEWFYKQRSSVNGHIPAGARLKAFQHMQRMMVAEGKLVLRPDGSYSEVAPQSWLSPLGAVTSTWTSIGPTPTTGGFFSPVTGRVTTIAIDPSDLTGNTVLIGGAMGGIWRSTDAGAIWTAVGDQNASLAMGSIAFAPSQPTTVYAGTGESESVAFDIYYGAGVLKSTDGGLHWSQTCTVPSSTCPFIGPYNDITPFGFFTLGGTRITYIAVNPANPQMVLVGAQTQFAEGTTEGAYCSDDGGITWSNILPDQLSSFVGFAFSTVAYAALGNPFGSSQNAPNGNGIYKATNIGPTCSTIHFNRLTAATLPAQSSMGRIDLGIAPSDITGNTVYASIADASTGSGTNLGVFVTTNGGTSWIQTAAPDICQHQCWYDNVVKVDPNNPNITFFGGSAVRDSSGNPSWVVRTEDGGTSWTSVIPNLPGGSSGLPHVDNHAIAFVKLPTGKVRLYLANDGGIWRTDDAEASTVTWTNLNNPSLTLTQFYPYISIDVSQPSISFGGTQDNGSQNYQGGVSWMDNQLCGDGASTAVDSIIPSTVYIGCATGIPVNASYENGVVGTFSPAVTGINPLDFSSFIPPLVTDPSRVNTAYFGTTRVYQTIDGGNTWTFISNDLVNGSNGDSLTALAVAPTNPTVVYVGADTNTNTGLTGLVFVATNVTPGNLQNFLQVSGQGSLPPRALTAIAVDPADNTGKTAYVTFSGFSFVNTSLGVNDPTGHIFKTTDGGATWKDVSCSVVVCTAPAATDLPNTPVNDIVIDPDLPGIIYAATDEGVFAGDCTTAPCKWSTLSTGLPHVVVLSLRLHEPSRTLRAATHGRGAWDITLNNFTFSGPHLTSITPTSANAGGAQFTLTVNGSGLTGGTIMFGSTALAPTGSASDATLSGTVPTALLATGAVNVTVTIGSPNPTATSNSLPFSVLSPAPTLTNCVSSIPAPTAATCGTPVQGSSQTFVQLALTGTNFMAGSKVLFNGSSFGVTTQFNSGTSLTATLAPALLVGFGSTNDIQVVNLPPGGGKSRALTFQVVAPPPPNDNFATAINITTLRFADTEDSSGATTESTDPVPPCAHQYTSAQGNTGGHPNGVYNTIWYKFTPVFSASLNVDTLQSSYDTVLSIWTGSAGNLVNVACNDDATVNGLFILQSQLLNVPLTTGTTYYIMVSSFGPPDPNPKALGGMSLLNFVYNNGSFPPPFLTSISPVSANSGDPGFNLTVNGTGFFNGATVHLFDTVLLDIPLTTTFVSSTQVTAFVPTSAIPFPGTDYVSVANPPSASSNNLVFTVNLGKYPVPTLNSITPNTAVAGSVIPLNIQAFGTLFATNAVLNFNGTSYQPNPGSFGSGHDRLQAAVPASAFAAPGTVQVSVANLPPGGGPSNSLPFTITVPNPVPTISSVNPASVASGSQATINITGTGFLSGAQVCVNFPNGFSCNYVSSFTSSQLSVSISFSNVPSGTYPLYVVDPAPGGTSASVNLTVMPPPDFSVTSTGTTTQTVNAGQTATFTNAITVSALNGFNAPVTLTCSLPPAATYTTCGVNPNTFATGSGTSTVSVTTMARGFAPPSLPTVRLYLQRQYVPLVLLTMLLAILLVRSAWTQRQRLAGVLPIAALVLFLVLEAIGCGGGGGGYTPPPPPTGTPAGTYAVTVTGTSGNTTHTTTLTLTVN